MASVQQTNSLKLYANLMGEVKYRISFIDTLLAIKAYLPASLLYESCFLQFRKICELIALACLAAHGEIAAVKQLRKEYHADKISNCLEKLHANFYPVPKAQVRTGSSSYIFTDINKDSLTKSDLIKLYRKCGMLLHRGSLKQLSFRPPTEDYLSQIMIWRQKIINLLNQHIITLISGFDVIVCMMESGLDGEVRVSQAKTPY